jgi:predicted RNase H-like HicB family nuclease
MILPMRKRSDPFTVLVEKDEEGYFVATVPELRGCHTQAKSLDSLMRRVQEVIAVCLADEPRPPPRRTFVGVQQVRVA